MQRFWDFILDRLISGIMHYDELDVPYPADQVLDSGWFDCQLGSALLAALCRARAHSGAPGQRLSALFGEPDLPLLG